MIREKIEAAFGDKEESSLVASAALSAVMAVISYLLFKASEDDRRLANYRKLVDKWRRKITTMNISRNDRQELYTLLRDVVTQNPAKPRKKKMDDVKFTRIRNIMRKYPEISAEFRKDLAKV